MKLLNRIGGAALVIIAAILVITGIRSQTGQSILDPLGTSAKRSWAWIRVNFPSLPGVAGNRAAALVVALALFSLAVIFIPGARGGKGMVAAAVAVTVIGFLAYQPSLIPR